MNHREVVEEDRRNKLPANWGAQQRKMEWEEEDEKARKVSTALWSTVQCHTGVPQPLIQTPSGMRKFSGVSLFVIRGFHCPYLRGS